MINNASVIQKQDYTQQIFTCSKSKTETVAKGIKYVQREQ